MASKAKTEAPPEEDEEGAAAEGEAAPAAPKKRGLVGKILGPVLGILRFANPLAILKLPMKLKLIAIAGLLVVLGGGGAAFYFFGMSSGKPSAEAAAESVKTETDKLPAAQAAFFDIPDIIVNIQTADTTPAYLKLSVSLELEKPEAKAAIEPVLPRITDQFQTYLRELRVEDIRGSAGVMRLKEELLRRVNLAVAPTPVRDVLLKEMIVQ
ncbi:MAG TPA: flagellar basal body-associated FliL family protein [Micropepsaceae bacterium]|nr:flagellar basal body-associated FliL family protein [Micropepsaceae bacterium]